MSIVSLAFIIWGVGPELITIPWINLPIRWYGIFWLAGLYLSYWILQRKFKEEDKSIELLDSLTWYIILGTIIGARLGHVLFYAPNYYLVENPKEIFAIWQGGLASHGGALGILFSLFIFAKTKKVDFWWLADKIALVIPLVCSLIRIGNLFNSEMIGKATTVPWAFIFTHYDTIPRHPAQLYEALLYFTTFVALTKISKIKPINQHGSLFAMMLISLFSIRFFMELFKLNQEPFEDKLLFNMGQLLSLPFILAGIITMLYLTKKKAAA